MPIPYCRFKSVAHMRVPILRESIRKYTAIVKLLIDHPPLLFLTVTKTRTAIKIIVTAPSIGCIVSALNTILVINSNIKRPVTVIVLSP